MLSHWEQFCNIGPIITLIMVDEDCGIPDKKQQQVVSFLNSSRDTSGRGPPGLVKLNPRDVPKPGFSQVMHHK